MSDMPEWETLEKIAYEPVDCPLCGADVGKLRFEKRIR